MIKKILKYIFKYILLPMLVLFALFSAVFKINLADTLLASLVFTLGINFIIGIFAIPIIIGKTLAHKTVQYEKLTKEDILKNKELYREILDNHSPSVLSYIDNMSFKFESIVIAMLLTLKQKKYIEIKNNQVVKLNNYNNTDLNFTEQYILNSVSNGKINVSKTVLQNNVIKDALKEDLVQQDHNMEKDLGKNAIISSAVFMILWVIVTFTDIFPSFIVTIFTIATLTFPITLFAFLISYIIKYNKNPYFRSKKGKEINKKLEGLKNYIKEYSLLKEKDSASIELWEDYLIYAVIFGQNNKITEDLLKYIILN